MARLCITEYYLEQYVYVHTQHICLETRFKDQQKLYSLTQHKILIDTYQCALMETFRLECLCLNLIKMHKNCPGLYLNILPKLN